MYVRVSAQIQFSETAGKVAEAANEGCGHWFSAN